MSLLRIGIDLVEIDDIRESVHRFGERYLTRVYTPAERAYAETSDAEFASRLAARFAAKEAVIKLLAPNDQPIPWRCIEVQRSVSGECSVALTGAARSLADEKGIHHISLSLTHHARSAAAVAVALSAGNSPPKSRFARRKLARRTT